MTTHIILPPHVARSLLDANIISTCSICLEEFNSHNVCMTLCGHYFCTICIAHRDICAMCRTMLGPAAPIQPIATHQPPPAEEIHQPPPADEIHQTLEALGVTCEISAGGNVYTLHSTVRPFQLWRSINLPDDQVIPAEHPWHRYGRANVLLDGHYGHIIRDYEPNAIVGRVFVPGFTYLDTYGINIQAIQAQTATCTHPYFHECNTIMLCLEAQPRDALVLRRFAEQLQGIGGHVAFFSSWPINRDICPYRPGICSQVFCNRSSFCQHTHTGAMVSPDTDVPHVHFYCLPKRSLDHRELIAEKITGDFLRDNGLLPGARVPLTIEHWDEQVVQRPS